MVKVDIAHVHRVRSKGREYHYAWRGGPRLHATPGSPEYLAELQAAQDGRVLGDAKKVSGLVARYRASPDYKRLAASTRRNWARWLDRIQDHFGPLSIRQFDRPAIRLDIRRWRDRWKAQPRAADYGLQVLSRVMSFAVAEGEIGLNPCIGIAGVYRIDRSELVWTDEDLAALYPHASPELQWAARLAAATGLRQADLVALAWTNVRGLAIERRTAKSGGRRTAVIPIHAELEQLLAEIPRRGATILTNTRGQPWRSGLGDSWRDAHDRAIAAHKAGTGAPINPDLHFHDLRGTAATRLWRAGLTLREIAEILGWSEDQVERLVDRYVKRDEILRDRIRRLDAASRTNQAGAS